MECEATSLYVRPGWEVDKQLCIMGHEPILGKGIWEVIQASLRANEFVSAILKCTPLFERNLR